MTTAPLALDRLAIPADAPAAPDARQHRAACPLPVLALNAALCFIIYWGLTTRLNFDARQSWYPVFIHQAAAFLDGRLDLPLDPATPGLTGSDLSFHNGRYFPYWPPLPSLLSVPLVALFGPAASDKLPAAALAALNVFLLGLLLNLAARHASTSDIRQPTSDIPHPTGALCRHAERSEASVITGALSTPTIVRSPVFRIPQSAIRNPQFLRHSAFRISSISPPTIVLLQLFYAFGTEPFSCVLSSGAMNQALILHETCLLASLAFLFADPTRPRNIVCAGLLWCACILTRAHTVLLAPLYALILYRANTHGVTAHCVGHVARNRQPEHRSRHAEQSEASRITGAPSTPDVGRVLDPPSESVTIPRAARNPFRPFVAPWLRGSVAFSPFRTLALCAALGVALMLLWNDLRFDSPFSSGVEFQSYGPASSATVLDEAPHGLLSPAYIPHNLWAHLLRPMFTLRGSFPFFVADGFGDGVLLTTPFWWLILWRWRTVRSNTLARDCLLSAIPLWLLLLCWYSTGGTQFGMRFLMDFLPLLLIPLAVAIGPRPTRAVLALCALSIVLRVGGTFLYMLDGVGGRLPPLGA